MVMAVTGRKDSFACARLARSDNKRLCNSLNSYTMISTTLNTTEAWHGYDPHTVALVAVACALISASIEKHSSKKRDTVSSSFAPVDSVTMRRHFAASAASLLLSLRNLAKLDSSSTIRAASAAAALDERERPDDDCGDDGSSDARRTRLISPDAVNDGNDVSDNDGGPFDSLSPPGPVCDRHLYHIDINTISCIACHQRVTRM